LIYVAALASVFFVRDLRSRRGCLAIALLPAVYMVGLTFIDNYKVPWYLLYITPLLATTTALVARWAWDYLPRAAVTAALSLMLLIPLSSISRLMMNQFSNEYRPMIRFLNDHAKSGQAVMGSADLIFGYGIRETLIDDDRLGFYSGKRPQMIVVDQLYQFAFDYYSTSDRPVYAHIRRCLDADYHAEFHNNLYRVGPINILTASVFLPALACTFPSASKTRA